MTANHLNGLDPELKAALDDLQPAIPRPGVRGIAALEARRRTEAALAAEMAHGVEAHRTCSVEDVCVAGPEGAPEVPVRIYRPEGFVPGGPAVLFIHGGGMCLGDLDYEHPTALQLCEELQTLVVSTGYRKAPEFPHPAAIEDCFAALRWMSDNASPLGFDTSRLAVFGGSAGGNLAIATALKARDWGRPAVAYVMSLYPMVDHRGSGTPDPEATALGVWDEATNDEAWSWYLAGQEPDGYAAPLHADLAMLPPIFIDVGTADLFRDENLVLVQRLLAAGVTTEFHLYPGVYHAAELYAPEADASRHMWSVRFRALRRALDIPTRDRS